MPVDNDLYHREAHTWWDDESFLSILRIAVNPVRLDYLNIVLPKLGIKPEGLRALDVGSGGGYLSEELSRLGIVVSGVDLPQLRSLRRNPMRSKPVSTLITGSPRQNHYPSRMTRSIW